MAKKILGKYIITANLPFPEYTFTGNNRTASMELNEDTRLGFKCGYVRGIYDDVRFVADNILFIKKARIVTHGAAGLRSMYNAATLHFFATNENSEPIGAFKFSLENFNEWTDVDIPFLSNSEDAIPPKKAYMLNLYKERTVLHLDDYNIQSAYIGQTFKPVLELMVDTNGIYEFNTNEVF